MRRTHCGGTWSVQTSVGRSEVAVDAALCAIAHQTPSQAPSPWQGYFLCFASCLSLAGLAVNAMPWPAQLIEGFSVPSILETTSNIQTCSILEWTDGRKRVHVELNEAHHRHLCGRVTAIICATYWWPTLDKDVRSYVLAIYFAIVISKIKLITQLSNILWFRFLFHNVLS